MCYQFYNILFSIHDIHDFGRNAIDSIAFLSQCTFLTNLCKIKGFCQIQVLKLEII